MSPGERFNVLTHLGGAILAVVGNVVVAFSWWGVNLMGVGLHSYGFTADLKQAVYLFYGFQALVVGLGLLGWLLERTRAQAAVSVLAQPSAPSDLPS